MKYKGYQGLLLTVDLSKGKIERRDLQDGLVEKIGGGKGLAPKIFYDENKGKSAPFSLDNRLLFITGPAAGTLIPTASRYGVGSKSPLTGTLSVGYAGGHFAPTLKFAGYDGLLISGKSPKPVYLLIDNQKVEIKDARHLWGKDTQETDEILKKELKEGFEVASIGQAGENGVSYASIANEQHLVGRGGEGAVMGWMNLKAVAVRGTGRVQMGVSGPAGIEEVFKLHDTIRKNPVREFFRT